MSLNISEQYDKIYRYCYLRVKNRETAEDLTQETFLRYLEHPQYHGIDKTLHLLYTIAGNLCMGHFRKHPASEITDDIPSDENIEDKILTSFSLQQALGRLSPQDREIILLRYINDVPVNVIGKLYGMSRFAAGRRIKKILEVLHNDLGKEELQ